LLNMYSVENNYRSFFLAGVKVTVCIPRFLDCAMS